MGEGKFDELKGRAKETAGEAVDDDRLEREGKTDRAAGSLKQRLSGVVDKVRDAVKRDR